MPILNKLSITNLRNLESVKIEASSQFNLIFGENGSGKTSILESIHLLGRAKTFRSGTKTPIIQNGADQCVIYGELTDKTRLGYSRTRSGVQDIQISGKRVKSSAALAEKIPLQLLNADAFKILEGSPSVRRSFLDWGVFHVEHSFIESWRKMQKALASRNALLKAKKQVDPSEIDPWNKELSKHAERVDEFRRNYIEQYQKALLEVMPALLPLDGFELSYSRGWDDGVDLGEVLNRNFDRDKRYGHTVSGPHRADILLQIMSEPAAGLLSRGQQKLLVIAMKLAQSRLLKSINNTSCVYLIDDLPAELDSANRDKVLSLLKDFGDQVFVTGIELDHLLKPIENSKEVKLFHVEHGKIMAN